jgi:hypothetical protein
MFSARPAHASHSCGRQDLHEPGEHDRVRVHRVHQLPHLGERLRLRRRARREVDVVERHAVGAHDVAEPLVVADHRLQPGGQLAGGDPPEQVVQAVRLLAHEEHGPLGHARVADRPTAAEPGRDLPELRPQLVDVERQRIRAHDLSREEPARVGVGVVARLDDPTPRPGEESGDLRHDAGGIRGSSA